MVGFDGKTAVTDDTGHTFAKDKPQKEYLDWNEKTPDNKETYGREFTPIDSRAKNMSCTNEEELFRNATELQRQSTDVFEWLYENNAPYLLSKSQGKTYGIPDQSITGRPFPK